MPIYIQSKSCDVNRPPTDAIYHGVTPTPPTPLACGATVNRHPADAIYHGMTPTPTPLACGATVNRHPCGCLFYLTACRAPPTPLACGATVYRHPADALSNGVPDTPHAVGVRRVNWCADALCFRGALVAEHFRLVPQAGFVEEAAVFIHEGYVAVMLLLVHYIPAFCLALRRP